jgi:hypothetical protein
MQEQSSAAGYAAHQPTPPDPHPHACIDGYVYIGYVVESPDDLDGEVVQYEKIPCRRCAEEAEALPAAIFEDEQRLGRPHSPRERKAFTDGFMSASASLDLTIRKVGS